MEKVTVIAHVEVRPGCEEEFLKAVPEVVAATRAEEACINYDCHQSSSDPTRFVFYENWTSIEGLNQHAASEHIREFRSRVSGLVVRPTEITLWKMVTTPAES